MSQLSRGYTPNKGDLQRIQRAALETSAAKLFIDDTPGISINELRAKARRKKRDEDIQFIAIDYLQLMKSRTKQAENSREREIAEISAGIKGLAKELGIPDPHPRPAQPGPGKPHRQKPRRAAHVRPPGIRLHRAGRRHGRPALSDRLLRRRRRGKRSGSRQGRTRSGEKPERRNRPHPAHLHRRPDALRDRRARRARRVDRFYFPGSR